MSRRERLVGLPQRPITGLLSRANTIAGAMTDNALADPPTADCLATWPYLRRGGPPQNLRRDQPSRRGQVHVDRGAGAARPGHHRSRRGPRQGGPSRDGVGLDGDGEGQGHLDHIDGVAVPVPHSVINLLDTPGHADFSEDTYRVLTAVDSAVMLIDAAKGLEPQTLKLFQVCKHRRIPIITVINKWDRPGRHALELMDEIQARIGLRPTPLTWPVGIAGDFKGVLDRRTGNFIRFIRTAGGATAAPEEHIAAADAHSAAGDDWDHAVEESELLSADGSDYDREQFLSGEATPVLFTSAALNFGVNQLLDVLVDIAPPPGGAVDVDGARRATESPFSAFVFKVQAGMDSAHRDRIAYARVCSGTFERGDVLTHAATGKPFVTKYAQSVFGQQRATLDTAWPGDVIGLANAACAASGRHAVSRCPGAVSADTELLPRAFRGGSRRRSE